MNLDALKDNLEKLLKYSLFRQLWYERWFRVAFLGFIAMLIFLALFLPKIWTTSKPGFLPVIKVSGLDLVQAWSLRRTAIKAAAAGDFEEANYAWLGALGNNQANPELARGALRNLLRDPRRKERTAQGLQQVFWLLRLTGTNLVDLELAGQVLQEFKYFDPIVTLVDPRRNEASPALLGIYLKALFHQGLMDVFNARWNQLGSKVEKDPELGLYHAAYLAGWGPPGTITDARQQLQQARQDPARKEVACRLALAVSGHELDADSYKAALTQLEELREDLLVEHVGYWRLLTLTGHKAEAIQLAQGYPHPPTTPFEVVELAQIYSDLGMRDEALQILERYASELGRTAIYWITYANELLEAKRWDDVRKVALRIRNESGLADQLSGYSYFLEGRAEFALGRSALATQAFSKTTDREFPFPSVGQNVASQLLQLGYPEIARQILVKLEAPLQREPAYWLLVFSAADQLKDIDTLVKSAAKAYELRPNDPVAQNNYAASMIIGRRNPQEVIKITLQLYSQNPNSLHAIVNHGAALLLNDRPKEAEVLLARVSTNKLTRAQLALYNLDLFETYYGLRQYDRAWAVSDLIDTDRLYPSQRQWLESVRQQLPPRPNSG